MIKEVIFSLQAPYREEMKIYGYTFGKGNKSACIVGPTRGNEVQQLYACSQLVRILSKLERTGAILSNNKILVIPSVNYYSMNIEKRFWAMDNSDINKIFPGDMEGETTERIAAAVFEKVSGYNYGIQFASFHTPGEFLPHVRLMETGDENSSLANLFGLPFVVLRKPEPFDYGTLNYNWQINGTSAFSVYSNATETIDEDSESQMVASVLRFLTRMGIIKFNCHSGYIASIIEEEALLPIRVDVSGIYRPLKKPGDEVKFGELLAEVINPMEGEVISQILAPSDGVIFFSHTKPLVMQNGIVYQLLRRLHM